MNYSIDFEKRDKFLEVTVKGKRNPATLFKDTIEALVEIERRAWEIDKCCILINWFLEGSASRDNGIETLSAIEDLGLHKGFKVAVIFDGPKNHQINRLTEILALKLDWQTSFFKDYNEAYSWITESRNKELQP